MDPATNRLLTVTIPGGSTDTWTYDAAGNPLTRTRSQNGTTQVSSYSWDALGNLSSVIRQGTTTLTFTYTPDGRLLQKECGTQVTTYASDFAGVSRESTTSSSPVTYQHGGAGELVSLTWNNQTYYYHFNAHGDTIALSDSTGALVAQYTYDPWGTLTSTTNPSIPNPYLYCGAYGVRWDADLSLYLMGARWYNPATGRFLTKDSYPPDLLAPLTQNPYQYCENNPVNRVDPTGKTSTIVSHAWTTIGTPERLSTIQKRYGRALKVEQYTIYFMMAGLTAIGLFGPGVGLTAWATLVSILCCDGALEALALSKQKTVEENYIPDGLGGAEGLKELISLYKNAYAETDEVDIDTVTYGDDITGLEFTRTEVVFFCRDRRGHLHQVYRGYWDGKGWQHVG